MAFYTPIDKTSSFMLLNTDNGEVLQTFKGNISSLAVSDNARYVLAGSFDRSLLLWELDWNYEFD